jgi:hypothetical protein
MTEYLNGNHITKNLPEKNPPTTLENKNSNIFDVLTHFDKKEKLSSNKPIPARDVFIQRLKELQEGKPIDIICFNCIDFRFQPNGTKYPQAFPSDDTRTVLAECYIEELDATLNQLQTLGNPNVAIIIPDSELLDENVFNFGQKINKRLEIRDQIQSSLEKKFSKKDAKVSLWSEFLKNTGLPSPSNYTERSLPLVMGKYQNKLHKMYAETKAYLKSKGLSQNQINQINPVEMTVKNAWYLAMYAGEGAAMKDLNAIVLNFENDGKVTTWYQRGAMGSEYKTEVLPIITPADTKKFKPWKETILQRKKESVVFKKNNI